MLKQFIQPNLIRQSFPSFCHLCQDMEFTNNFHDMNHGKYGNMVDVYNQLFGYL